MAWERRKKTTKNGKQLIERLGCMGTWFRSASAEKLLRVAAILCIISGVLIPWLIDRRSLSICIYPSVMFFVAGTGLIMKQKWAQYLAIFVSVLTGAALFIVLLYVLSYLFRSPSAEIRFSTIPIRLIIVFGIGAIPGYILLRPEVKNLFTTKEN
jgi:hypothetical protein